MVGKIVRLNVRFLQRLYLPSSVIGGVIGLVIFSLLKSYAPENAVLHLDEMLSTMGKVPGFLINVVFATLFLGAVTPSIKRIFAISFPQICLGQILAWGQYVVGLGITGLVLIWFFDIPPAFGNLIEIGFQGGHGTVGGMRESFIAYDWEDGIALGLTVATIGMIVGIVIGMILINWAYSKGIVKSVLPFDARRMYERKGVHCRGKRPSAGAQTVMSDSIDSLAWHLVVVGMAIAVGAGLHALIPMKGFPLFPLCMVGGILLQALVNCIKKDLLVDRVQMERISGAALDFLVVSAVATIKLEVVKSNFVVLLVLSLGGIAWSVFAVMYFGKRLFAKHWFERAIADFGQATGVTATGLMLLRTVDPENKTCAAASFGYKQLFHEPIMGGGLWTAFAFVLVYKLGWIPVFAFSLLMLVVWIVVAFAFRERRKPAV